MAGFSINSSGAHWGLEETQFFMGNGLLYGTPVAMKWSLDMIKSLEPFSGLKMKYVKMSVYAPNSETAQICRDLLPNQLAIHEDEDMNFVYLKPRLGTIPLSRIILRVSYVV